MGNIKIIVAAHKKYQMPTENIYLPLQVGAEGKDRIIEYKADNEGENISEKNPYFCELTRTLLGLEKFEYRLHWTSTL